MGVDKLQHTVVLSKTEKIMLLWPLLTNRQFGLEVTKLYKSLHII